MFSREPMVAPFAVAQAAHCSSPPCRSCSPSRGHPQSAPRAPANQREGRALMNLLGANIFVLIIVALAILTLLAGVKTVSQGYNWTVERFGRYTRTLAPGLNLIVPYFDRIGRKINMMEQAIDIPQQDVITKDNATVAVDGLAFFQVF